MNTAQALQNTLSDQELRKMPIDGLRKLLVREIQEIRTGEDLVRLLGDQASQYIVLEGYDNNF